MKKISLALVVILSLLLVLGGCGAAGNSMAMDKAEMEAPMASSMPTLDVDGAVKDYYESTETTESIYNSDSNKIIRTANITIQSTEFDSAVAALNHLTEQMGGYFETADIQSGGYYNQYANRSAYYVVRVPKENFVAFRNGSSGIGHVYSISENSQDVGETYYDTEARLATLTTKRDRLLALLEKADKMSDIITLENALADVQYEIDRHTATLRKYDSLIGYSTFYIRINEVSKITEEPGIKESFGSKFVSSLKKGFAEFGETLQDFAIWFARNLIGIVIFIAVVAVVVIVIRRKLNRRRARKQDDSE